MKALIHICSLVDIVSVELSDQVSLSLSKIEDLHTHTHKFNKKKKVEQEYIYTYKLFVAKTIVKCFLQA